jgi:hypothetical protein
MQLIRDFINIKIVTDVESPGDFLVNGKLSTALFMHTANEHFANVTVTKYKSLLVWGGFVQFVLQLRVKNYVTSLLDVLQEISSQGYTKSCVSKYETFTTSFLPNYYKPVLRSLSITLRF